MTDLGRLICTLVVASALIQSVSCSSGEARRPTQPASGTLKILGKVAPGATLVFHPKVDPNHWTVFCRFLASEIPQGLSLVPVTQA